ncbi:MAG: ABC transporter ATP-binding protein [Candidatus Paceibacterota bacterium]
MDKVIIKIENLFAGYGDLQILKNVDMSVNSSDIVAIIGPNGAGKSTVLRSIFNLCNVYKGKIIFKNKNITNLSTHNLISEGISYVPQGRQVFPNLSVKENLEMGAFTMNNKEVIERNIKDVYEKFPILKERGSQLAGNLSGGEQQMLAIGRALIQDPELILLDEPSLGLSPKAMKEVFDSIKEINKEGISIIIVEQNAKQAVQIADKTYILENGEIALEGGRDILKDEKIKNIYFGGR